MKIVIDNIDNNLIDVTSYAGPDEIPGMVVIGFKVIGKLEEFAEPDILLKMPIFRDLQNDPKLNKSVAQGMIGLSALPSELQKLWEQFHVGVISWLEEQVVA